MAARWYVVHTHAHAEPKAAENLQRQGFTVYLPQTRRWRMHARRRDMVLRPLFPRYLFVNFDVEHARWRLIFSTLGVVSLLCHGEQPRCVSDDIIGEIRVAESDGTFDDTQAAMRLNPGDAIRIVCGPFADIVGKLQSLVSKDRVRVLLDILGRQVLTVVDVAEVLPA